MALTTPPSDVTWLKAALTPAGLERMMSTGTRPSASGFTKRKLVRGASRASLRWWSRPRNRRESILFCTALFDVLMLLSASSWCTALAAILGWADPGGAAHSPTEKKVSAATRIAAVREATEPRPGPDWLGIL